MQKWSRNTRKFIIRRTQKLRQEEASFVDSLLKIMFQFTQTELYEIRMEPKRRMATDFIKLLWNDE